MKSKISDDALSLYCRPIMCDGEPAPLNMPGHSHKVPGVWDRDNVEFAGTTCNQCAAFWRLARRTCAQDGSS